MHTNLPQQQRNTTIPTKTYINTNKSKLDKSQAKRLKMPKRNRSAYFLFSMDTRAKLKAELKDQITPLEMQAKVSQYWKELSPSAKRVYEHRAKQEKIEYIIAMDKFYATLTPETLERTKTNRPKKPCSAYAHFVRDIKIQLKQENPKLIMQEILHIVSDKWKNLSEKERHVYEEKARLDKEQYLIATHRYFPSVHRVSKLKSQNYQETQKPVNQLEESSIEEQIFKKVKVEPSVVKTEETSNGEGYSFETVKVEQDQRISSALNSPVGVKAESDINHEIQQNNFLVESCKMEPLAFAENVNYVHKPQGLEIPEVNKQQNFVGYNRNQNIGFDINERIRELTIAKLSWMRIAQANQSVDEAIRRKIAEAKNLQAQRLMLVQNLFWTPNGGIL